jgi:hypothetical protein
MFADLRKHWSENQIVEILAVVSVCGFLNRWNDSLGTPLEPEPLGRGPEVARAARPERRQAPSLARLAASP